MLRGKPISESGSPPVPPPGDRFPAAEFPCPDSPYALEERATGVLFYQGGISFYLPYHLLLRMDLAGERLILNYAREDVLIQGRGLHEVYLHLAAHRLARLTEQGERYRAILDTPVVILKIESILKEDE